MTPSIRNEIIPHGFGGRLDLPVPLSYFVVVAAAVMVISFVLLALLWPEPRLQDGPRYEPARLVVRRGWILPVLGLAGLLLVVGQLIPPLLGVETVPTRPSIAPVLVWVMFWLVVPFAGVVIGDWYTDINPWRTLGRGLRVGNGERIEVLDRVGIWPASILLLSFTWLELVHPETAAPVTLGIAALSYSLLLVVLMAFAGRETGLAVFDAFTPYNRFFSSISPLGRREDGRLVWRGWLRSLTVVPAWKALPIFVVVVIGTVSYDGASSTTWFRTVFAAPMETLIGRTLLLLASVLVIGTAYLLASATAARMVGGEWTAVAIASRFAHTLVPIALAYAVAHYLTLIIFEGQQLISTVSDPFALGWNLFGTADRRVDFFITAAEPIWYLQVAVIVTGHVLGVILAHDRALADFGPEAIRSQYAMLVLMIALTTLGLLILAG